MVDSVVGEASILVVEVVDERASVVNSEFGRVAVVAAAIVVSSVVVVVPVVTTD